VPPALPALPGLPVNPLAHPGVLPTPPLPPVPDELPAILVEALPVPLPLVKRLPKEVAPPAPPIVTEKESPAVTD
jgi:hypothetical protein